MKKIYYEKVGRRYRPVSEYDSDFVDAFPRGAHLVVTYPGGQSTHYKIDPNYAAMIAAGRVAEEAICRALFVASEAQPKQRPITARQRAAWEEMKAAFGDEFFSIQFSSTRDLAETAVKAMQKEADMLLSNPSVRAAYDHFLLVAELAKGAEHD